MTQKDMESIVSGINQLNGLLVITIPDCLLYSAWQRKEDEWDTEIAGAYFGQLVALGVDGLKSMEEWSSLSQMTLELEQGVMVLKRTKGGDFAVVYVFEPGTAMGWVRMQVGKTYSSIEGGLGGGGDVLEDEFEEPADVPTKDEAAAADDDVAEAASEGSDASSPAAPSEADMEIDFSIDPKPAASAETRGTRLIKYLGEHAGDTHAALLRVSLQTGLPLTRLREPDNLSEEEYSKVEESVRLILGVDQLNL